MKKSIIAVLIMTIVLFPTVVNAEELPANATRYEEIRASVSETLSKVRDFVEERRAEREEAFTPITIPQIVIENTSESSSFDTTITIDEEIGNVEIHSVAKISGDLTNNDGIFKDSNGSISTDIANAISLRDQDLFDNSNTIILDVHHNDLSYCLDSEKFNITGNTNNLVGTNYENRRVDLFGNERRLLNNSLVLRNNNNTSFDIDKTKNGNKTIFDIAFNTSGSNSIKNDRTLTRRNLFGKEDTSTKSFSYETNYNHSKKKSIVISNGDDPEDPTIDPSGDDPEDPTIDPSEDDESGTISTDKPAYYSANTSNPLTNDSAVKDLIMLLVSITGLTSLLIIRK